MALISLIKHPHKRLDVLTQFQRPSSKAQLKALEADIKNARPGLMPSRTGPASTLLLCFAINWTEIGGRPGQPIKVYDMAPLRYSYRVHGMIMMMIMIIII